MPSIIRVAIFGIILFLLDLYFYQAIIVAMKGSTLFRQRLVFWIYWGFTIVSFMILVSPAMFGMANLPKFFRVYVFAFVVMLIISKIIGSVFIAIDDIIRLFRWIGSLFVRPEPTVLPSGETGITRLKFLSYIALGMAAIPFGTMLYGMFRGAFNYQVHKVKVVLPNLPSAFNGLKILQISDIHSGSFLSATPLEEAVKIIMEQKADVIFFTGDLVNDRAVEVEPLMATLSKIKAPMGVYSTLGNHDYGDYTTWESNHAKMNNIEDLMRKHGQMGWRLLMNEHVPLKRGDAEIAVIGIENWGAKMNFPKYGRMDRAYAGTEKYPVKLLLSHDPSHWSHEVRQKYPDVDVTFSGHTHGFQFGIEIPGLKWSPSQYVYKQWAGLYSEGNQHLYVNRGLGFLGYPGRVGILPEITVMELYNA
jgi:predicted MPP superfamily phosphohydrolase